MLFLVTLEHAQELHYADETSTNCMAFPAHRGCCLEADPTLPIDRGWVRVHLKMPRF